MIQKALIAIPFLLFIAPAAHAQTFALKAGRSKTNVFYSQRWIHDKYSRLDQYPNYHINLGLTAYLPLTEKIRSSWELEYSGKGSSLSSRYEGHDTTIHTTSTYGLSYLQFSPKVRLALCKCGAVELNIGPYIGYLLKGEGTSYTKFSVDSSDRIGIMQQNLIKTSNHRRLDFGATVGIGYNYKDKIRLMLNYSHSLFDTGRYPGTPLNSYNQVVSVDLYFSIYPLSNTIFKKSPWKKCSD